jgi:hypothetical protein
MLNNQEVVNQVIADVMPVISRLSQGETVKTVDLFKPVIWQATSNSDHIKYGKIIAKLSREKLLPLLIIESTSKNHRQFVVDHH